MTDRNDWVEERLQRLRSSTAGLRARAGFEERVLASVMSAGESDWWVQVIRVGRAGLIAAAFAASAGGLFAVQSQRESEATSAVAYGTQELDW